jgi:hypothetical protein
MKLLNSRVSPDGGAEEYDGQDLSLHPKALTAYVTELLEKAFPVESITTTGSSLEVETLSAVRPEEVISLSGKVVAKGEESGLRLVECEIIIENQGCEIVAQGVAVVSL